MDYIIENQPMTSGQGEAIAKQYHKYEGKSGRTWLVADVPNAGDYVYVTNNPENTTSYTQGFQGFGGATLPMLLVEGSIFQLRGGWHSNSEALYEDTGVDVRDKHLTFIVVARQRVFEAGQTILKDVLYKDLEPVIGLFDRGKFIANKLYQEFGDPLLLYSRSNGGSSLGGFNGTQADN